jgi:integrase
MGDQVRVRMLKRPKQRKTRSEPNRKHFTADNVLKLRPNKRKQYLVWDAGTGAARGLAILVSPTGTASYRTVFYFKGSPKPHWMNLGRVGEMTLEEARDAARDARRNAKEGIDPRGTPDRSDSFKAAVESYIKDEQIGSAGNKSAGETQKVILNNCRDWLPRSVATIRYDEIQRLLSLIRDGDEHHKPRRYLANRLHSHLKSFFAWCVPVKLKASPMATMKKPFKNVQARDRVWFKKEAADDAIKSLWRVADKMIGEGQPSEGKYVKIMLLLGKRKAALADMRWEEIDSNWFWDAPESGTNKRLHGVPLARLAQGILGPRQSGKVFGAINLDRLQRQIRDRTGLKDFFWHGLRHLAETKCAGLKDEQERPLIPPHIRDLLFDHSTKRGAGKGYDHHDYLPEMRSAMEAWAGYVDGLVTPPGVTRLRG